MNIDEAHEAAIELSLAIAASYNGATDTPQFHQTVGLNTALLWLKNNGHLEILHQMQQEMLDSMKGNHNVN